MGVINQIKSYNEQCMLIYCPNNYNNSDCKNKINQKNNIVINETIKNHIIVINEKKSESEKLHSNPRIINSNKYINQNNKPTRMNSIDSNNVVYKIVKIQREYRAHLRIQKEKIKKEENLNENNSNVEIISEKKSLYNNSEMSLESLKIKNNCNTKINNTAKFKKFHLCKSVLSTKNKNLILNKSSIMKQSLFTIKKNATNLIKKDNMTEIFKSISLKNTKNQNSKKLNSFYIKNNIEPDKKEILKYTIKQSSTLDGKKINKLNTKIIIDNNEVKGYFMLKGNINKIYPKIKDGYNKIIMEDTSTIEGNFKNSKINGFGIFQNLLPYSTTFTGEYKDNIPNGYGIYTTFEFSLESKDWYKNNINNIGIAEWEDGDKYEGEFKDGQFNGIGSYIWSDGTIYKGYFEENEINGMGFIQFPNGNQYYGEFNKGVIQGFGRFYFNDGKIYIGHYLENKKDNFGIFIDSLEPIKVVMGFWKEGQLHGIYIKLLKNSFEIRYAKNDDNDFKINKDEIGRYMMPYQKRYRFFFINKLQYYQSFLKKCLNDNE